MSESLYIAASGMHAQQTNLDVIANNLANLNTMGFKKSRVDFEDLMYREIARVNGLAGDTANSNSAGVGTGIANTSKVFTVGDVKKTERNLDVMIQGNGFFEIMMPDGEYGYTRNGSFQVDKDGMLVTADGYALSSMIQLPDNMEDLLINTDGTVKVKIVGEDQLTEIGKIELAKFVNSAGLQPIGDNTYLPSEQSGNALYATPGEDGSGLLTQGFLEASNVKMVEELTNMVLAQRAYEINSKVIQASDEMLGIINNLRR